MSRYESAKPSCPDCSSDVTFVDTTDEIFHCPDCGFAASIDEDELLVNHP